MIRQVAGRIRELNLKDRYLYASISLLNLWMVFL